MESGSLRAVQNLVRPVGFCLLVIGTDVGYAILHLLAARMPSHIQPQASGMSPLPSELETPSQPSSSRTALGCVVGAVVSFWPKWEEGRNVDSRVAPGLLFQSPQLGQGSGAAPEPCPLFSRGPQCSLAHGRQCILRS